MSAAKIRKKLRSMRDADIAAHSMRFFKTGKGEYGEGDKFLGIRVPVLRKCVREYRDTPLEEVNKLLSTGYHEERLFALLLLVNQFSRANEIQQKSIYDFYLNNTKYINNWDLVDSSAHQIVGSYLFHQKRTVLSRLAKSNDLWERRIAIIATYHFIKQQQFADTLKISRQLLSDPEDLIHKAVGWMLREVGNRDIDVEMEFLNPRYKKMPRTMLRYAIEKFPEKKRKSYLNGLV